MKVYRSRFAGMLVVALVSVMPVLAVAQAQGSGLTVEQRLRRLEDEAAIRRILIDYAATQDARDYDAYAALFAKDGECVNGKSVYKGRPAIRQLLVGLYGTPPPGYVNSESFH